MSTPMIANCTQPMITEIVGLRSQGLPHTEIAQRAGFAKSTIARYLRIYDRYGITAFATSRNAA